MYILHTVNKHCPGKRAFSPALAPCGRDPYILPRSYFPRIQHLPRHRQCLCVCVLLPLRSEVSARGMEYLIPSPSSPGCPPPPPPPRISDGLASSNLLPSFHPRQHLALFLSPLTICPKPLRISFTQLTEAGQRTPLRYEQTHVVRGVRIDGYLRVPRRVRGHGAPMGVCHRPHSCAPNLAIHPCKASVGEASEQGENPCKGIKARRSTLGGCPLGCPH